MAALVHPVPVSAAASPKAFSDVPESSPFHDDIAWMADNAISEGYDDGTYRPTLPVTRQSMAAFLHRLNTLLGGPEGPGSLTEFSDVPESSPFHDDIAWMADSAISHGYDDGTYRPTSPVTRQSMAAFLHRLNTLVVRSRFLCSDQVQVPEAECGALVALYLSTDGTNWALSDGWLEGDAPCSWAHVVCTAGHVTELLLDSNRLDGSLPPEIGDLSELEGLVLVSNPRLVGGIPPEIGSLAKLRRLIASITGLTGPMPAELGQLTALEALTFGGSDLTGTIPPELGNLTNLTELGLDDNQLTGPIPASLGNLTALTGLYLGHNNLTGPIPGDLGLLADLEVLRLESNMLTGSIPSDLGSLGNLERLYLDHNDLSGQIPTSLGDITPLLELRLDHNMLTGSIPPELGQLTSLVGLQLGQNLLTGGIPTSLSGLTSIRVLHLADNDLSGAVPASFEDLLDLYDLALAGNACLTADTPELAAWLTTMDPAWDDGC